MDNTDERVRARANELIGLMTRQANWVGAQRLAELMVELGYFPAVLQRPNRYVFGLSALAVHRAEKFEVAQYLENHAAMIRDEVMRFLESERAAFSDVEEPLVDHGGEWQELIFFEAGVRSANAARWLPVTSAIIDDLPANVRASGVIMLSRVAPNTHIVPHCGETNGRLRLHLGIKVPPDSIMRVGTETVRWQEGKCVVFDDSFEHEVWNLSDEDRIILIVDLPHPEMLSGGASACDVGTTALHRRVTNLMKEAHLTGLYLDEAGDELRLIPDKFLSGKLRRYLKDMGSVRIELDGDEQLYLD